MSIFDRKPLKGEDGKIHLNRWTKIGAKIGNGQLAYFDKVAADPTGVTPDDAEYVLHISQVMKENIWEMATLEYTSEISDTQIPLDTFNHLFNQ